MDSSASSWNSAQVSGAPTGTATTIRAGRCWRRAATAARMVEPVLGTAGHLPAGQPTADHPAHPAGDIPDYPWQPQRCYLVPAVDRGFALGRRLSEIRFEAD